MWLVPLLLTPIALIAGGFVVGLVVEWLVLTALRRQALWASPTVGDVLARALRHHIIAWGTLGGAFLALESVPITLSLLDLADEPLAPRLLDILQTVLLVLLITSLTFVGARIVGDLVHLSTQQAENQVRGSTIFSKLGRYVVIVIGLLVVLQALNVPVTPLLTTLGVASLAVGLALQGPLSNLFSGIYILASRKIRPGDYIRLASTGQEGYVVDTDFQYTTLRELPNNIVVVPNASLATAQVRNYSLPEPDLSVLIDVGVSLDSDLNRVEQVTLDVARETLQEVPGGVAEFEPMLRYGAFEEFRIRFTVSLRAREFVDQYLLKHEFIKRLQTRYHHEGIEIPIPMRQVHIASDAAEAGAAPGRPFAPAERAG